MQDHDVADGIMIARETWRGSAYRTDAHAAKELIIACNKISKPVIVATQMLDSMIEIRGLQGQK